MARQAPLHNRDGALTVPIHAPKFWCCVDFKLRYMPSIGAVARVGSARVRVEEAHRHHRDFIDRLGRSCSPEERVENTRLLRVLSRSIADYFEAFEQAAEEDDPVQYDQKIQP